MARIIPSDLTRRALSGAHEPEITTLAHLKDALPEEYTVFHGVHWSRQYRGGDALRQSPIVGLVSEPRAGLACGVRSSAGLR